MWVADSLEATAVIEIKQTKKLLLLDASDDSVVKEQNSNTKSPPTLKTKKGVCEEAGRVTSGSGLWETGSRYRIAQVVTRVRSCQDIQTEPVHYTAITVVTCRVALLALPKRTGRRFRVVFDRLLVFCCLLFFLPGNLKVADGQSINPLHKEIVLAPQIFTFGDADTYRD